MTSVVVVSEEACAQHLASHPAIIREAITETLAAKRAGSLAQSKTSLRISPGDVAANRLTSMMGMVGIPPSLAGFKIVASARDNPKVGRPRAAILVVLCDPQTAAITTIVEGAHISTARTAEMTYLGVDAFASGYASAVIIGRGRLGKVVGEGLLQR